jgi:hypothetical protein
MKVVTGILCLLISISIILTGCSKSTTATVAQTSAGSTTSTSITATTSKPIASTAVGFGRSNPVPMGQSIVADGMSVTVTKLTSGAAAWDIIHSANEFNEAPSQGMQYILITLKVNNISSSIEPYDVYYAYYSLFGSSNVEYKSFSKTVVLPDSGEYHELNTTLSHGGQTVESLSFYLPQNETNLVLVWSFGNTSSENNKRYFEVK